MKTVKAVSAIGLAVLVLTMAALPVVADPAQLLPEVIVEYEVPGSPLNINVEAPGRIWFTMPDDNAIGRLVVDEEGTPTFTPFDIHTTPNSRPYDLVYANNAVWFTQFDGNNIGRLDPNTGDITEYAIPTAGSGPAGIAVAPDGTVWFVERNADQLGRLTPQTSTIQEFPLIVNGEPGTNAGLEDVAVRDNDSIWLTAPEINHVFEFTPSEGTFIPLVTTDLDVQAVVQQPFGLTLDSRGVAWVTAPVADRIGQHTAGTVSLWRWFRAPTPGGGPTGIDSTTADGLDYIWFTESVLGWVGQLVLSADGEVVRLQDYPLPSANSRPHGIAVDEQGHAWIAERGINRIAEWRPPYFHYFLRLPLVLSPPSQ
jgi:virginiamycin B lyase